MQVRDFFGGNMEKIDIAREQINRIDREMASLFVQRMQAVELVSEYKRERGLPVLDQKREDAVIAKNTAYVEDDVLRGYYTDFLKETMKLSRTYQSYLQKGVCVAFAGVEGAFAEVAAKKIFPNAERRTYGDFVSAYKAVEDGVCDVAVLPIENSFAGEVGSVIDLLNEGSLYINGIYNLPIVQNLLAIPGTTLEEIKTVISHPQALGQCGGYIKEHGFEKMEAVNTAVAAQIVAEKKDKTLAAIAGIDTAKLYDLSVIDHDINQSRDNTTRFAVVSKIRCGGDKNKNSVLTFTVSHEAGSLAKAIAVIGKHGFNMTALRSRPRKNKSWQYYFYVELDGNVDSEDGKRMIDEMGEFCSEMKILGSFSDDQVL